MKIKHKADPLRHRAHTYPRSGDALDAIQKGFRAIIDSGIVQLPQETIDWVEACETVKRRLKKEVL